MRHMLFGMITNILGSESGLCIVPLSFISVEFTTALAVMGVPTIIFYIMPRAMDFTSTK